MHNELLHIGPVTVYGYGFMIAMGVLAAWFVAEQRARKLKVACEHIFYLVVWCAIGGFASAKILFWITNWREFLQNPRQIIGSDGFVVYGGIIGGILVGWLYCRTIASSSSALVYRAKSLGVQSSRRFTLIRRHPPQSRGQCPCGRTARCPAYPAGPAEKSRS